MTPALTLDNTEVNSTAVEGKERCSKSGGDGEDFHLPPQPVSSKIASALGVGGGPDPPSAATPATSASAGGGTIAGEVSVGACLSPRKPRGSTAFFRYSPLLMKRGNRPKNLPGGGAGNQSSGEGETAAELGKMSLQGGYQGGDQVRMLHAFDTNLSSSFTVEVIYAYVTDVCDITELRNTDARNNILIS